MIDEDIPSDEECPKCHGVVMLEERERMNGTIVEVAVDCDVCDARYPEVDYGDDA
jgi:C4-type Zn-finger protein